MVAGHEGERERCVLDESQEEVTYSLGWTCDLLTSRAGEASGASKQRSMPVKVNQRELTSRSFLIAH